MHLGFIKTPSPTSKEMVVSSEKREVLPDRHFVFFRGLVFNQWTLFQKKWESIAKDSFFLMKKGLHRQSNQRPFSVMEKMNLQLPKLLQRTSVFSYHFKVDCNCGFKPS